MPAIRASQDQRLTYMIDVHGGLDNLRSDPLQDTARAKHTPNKRLSPPKHAMSRYLPATATSSVSSHPYSANSSQSATITRPRKKKAPNAFILYRSDVLSRGLLPDIIHQNTASVLCGDLWKFEPDDVKRKYYKRSAELKKMMDEDYERKYGPSGKRVKTQGQGKMDKPGSVASDGPFPTVSYTQPLFIPNASFTLPDPPIPSAIESLHCTYPDFSQGTPLMQSFNFHPFSPCSSTESCFPPTPELSGNPLPVDFTPKPYECFGFKSPASQEQRPHLEEPAIGSTSAPADLQKLLNDLFPIPDAEPQVPIAFDDTTFHFNSSPPIPQSVPSSMAVSDSEDVSWARVRACIGARPDAAVPGIGFSVSLLGGRDDAPQRSFGTPPYIPFFDHTEKHKSCKGAEGTCKPAETIRPDKTRRLAIPPGSSTGWSDAFKEFATGRSW